MHKVPASLDHPSGKAVPVVILNGLLFGLRLAACSLAGDRDLVSDNFPLHTLLGGSFLCQKLNYSRVPSLISFPDASHISHLSTIYKAQGQEGRQYRKTLDVG